MSFGGLILTNRGRNLQAKAQAGAQLNFTRIAVGDGELGGSSILDLNALIHEVKTLDITKFVVLTGGKAVCGGYLSNQDLATGFYWRELGLYATDPDLGEILYCYGNAGADAEYIPAGGGPDVVEKHIDIVSIVGNAPNVTATIDPSLVFATIPEVEALISDHINGEDPHPLYIKKSLATALNDFLVASGQGQWIKKTLAEVKAILELGSAAYTNSDAYAASGHNHDSAYAAAGHNHTGVYATSGHNHDGVYSASGHNHSGVYAPVAHTTPAATTSAIGHVELATNAEVTAGTDTARAVTPAGLKVELDKKINNSLATAADQFMVSSGIGAWAVKTIVQVKALLGLGSAAYTDSTAYATATQGTKADNALPRAGGTMSGEVNHADQLVTRPKLKDYSEAVTVDVTGTGTQTLDITTANVFEITQTGAITFVFSNPPASGSAGSITLILNKGATAYAITWPASVKWDGDEVPDLSAVNKTAILTFVTTDGGARWYGGLMGAEFTT
ncbi:MAG TPA: phage tail protein [Clostridia bacterium]|nr:phage tail protein [Clostridia bacterium]